MKATKVLLLGVAVALLLIPRRSSKLQTLPKANNNPTNPNDKNNNSVNDNSTNNKAPDQDHIK